jgi:hypothetical protein
MAISIFADLERGARARLWHGARPLASHSATARRPAASSRLVMRKTGGWRIVHDHTSLGDRARRAGTYAARAGMLGVLDVPTRLAREARRL